jgi:hypothetical protein
MQSLDKLMRIVPLTDFPFDSTIEEDWDAGKPLLSRYPGL